MVAKSRANSGVLQTGNSLGSEVVLLCLLYPRAWAPEHPFWSGEAICPGDLSIGQGRRQDCFLSPILISPATLLRAYSWSAEIVSA